MKTRDKTYSNYYYLKSKLLSNYIVPMKGVEVDLSDNTISDSMKHRIRTKRYESVETNFIKKYIEDDKPVIDLGAGIGYTSCFTENSTVKTVPIISLEANPQLIPIIKRTIRLNSANIKLIHAAYHPWKESIDFHVADDFWSSSTYDREDKEQNQTTVPALSLNDILNDHEITNRSQLIIDIEGGEHELITHELNLLKEYCETLLIELHPYIENEIKYYESILIDNDFKLVESQENVYCFRNID